MTDPKPLAHHEPSPRIVVRHDATPTPDGAKALEVLQLAVTQTLERKRRLGQYAVVWRNGQAVEISP